MHQKWYIPFLLPIFKKGAMYLINAVEIEGTVFPVAYNGYNYSRNKIWSKNTGRNDYGEMVGTIVAIKDKIELQLPPITGEQAKVLDDVVSDIDNPYPTAKVLFLGGEQKEMTIYTGDITYPFLTRARNEDGLIVGAKLSLVQK